MSELHDLQGLTVLRHLDFVYLPALLGHSVSSSALRFDIGDDLAMASIQEDVEALTTPEALHGDPLQHIFSQLDMRSLCTAVQVRYCMTAAVFLGIARPH